MKPKLSQYYTIAFVVVIVFVASQAYWLYNSFRDNKRQAIKEINTTLKEYTLGKTDLFLGNMVAQDSTIGEDEVEKLKLVQNLINDLSNISTHPDENISIVFKDSINSLLDNNTSTDTIAKEIRILGREIDEYLAKNDINIEYNIFLHSVTDSTRLDTINGKGLSIINNDFLRSDKFTLHSSKQYFYITVENGIIYVLKRIKFSILFSFVLTIIAVFVFVVFLRTISNQMKLNQIKNDFVNNMTHELKTPLATCSAALESIVRFNVIDDKEKTLKYIAIVQNEITRIKALADMLLTTSSIENKTINYNFEKVDLVYLIKNTLKSFELAITEKNITFRQQLSSKKLYIKGDKFHLTNVISNVIDNSIKYNMENGSIDLKVNENNKNAELIIINTGKGFPKEYVNKVFDKFFRVPTNNIHNVKGYGLGLNYAKNVIEDHNGYIFITSDDNELTTLTITLPLYE